MYEVMSSSYRQALTQAIIWSWGSH